MRTAPAGGPCADEQLGDREHALLIKPPHAPQAKTHCSIFTAVPTGRYWTVKAIGRREIVRLGRFDNRLEALGAAVLLAAQAEGSVLP